MLFDSLIRLIRIQRQVKVSSLEESGRIKAHENVPFPMEITKEGTQTCQSLRNPEVYLKETTVSYDFHALAQDCPN